MAPHRRRKYMVNSRFQLRWSLLAAVSGGFIAAFFASWLWMAFDQQTSMLGQLMESDKRMRSATEDIMVLLINMPETTAKDAKALRTKFDTQLERYAESSRVREEMIVRVAGLRPFLIGFVVFLVVFLFVWGLFVTHRIAGPIYVFKSQLVAFREKGAIAERNLREGDEFQDVYEEMQRALGAPTERRSGP
jgi:hypothetical protein